MGSQKSGRHTCLFMITLPVGHTRHLYPVSLEQTPELLRQKYHPRNYPREQDKTLTDLLPHHEELTPIWRVLCSLLSWYPYDVLCGIPFLQGLTCNSGCTITASYPRGHTDWSEGVPMSWSNETESQGFC